MNVSTSKSTMLTGYKTMFQTRDGISMLKPLHQGNQMTKLDFYQHKFQAEMHTVCSSGITCMDLMLMH